MGRGARIALGLAVSGGLLALVLWPLDLAQAWARARAASPAALGLALGASLLVLIARSVRFHALTAGATRGQVIAAIAVQNFLLRITPLRAGELSLPWLLRQASGESAARTLVALVLVRLADLCVLLVAAMAAGLAWFGAGEGGTLVALAVGAVALLLALIRFRQVVRLLLRLARGTASLARVHDKAVVRKVFSRLDEALADGERLTRRQWLTVAIGTLVVATLQFALFAALLAAFGSTPDLRQLVVGASLAQITGALPVTTVGSFGTHEAGWIGGFVWVGMPLQEAALTAVATQVVTLAFAGLFAAPAAWRLAATSRRAGHLSPR